jgi:hypothetical protein
MREDRRGRLTPKLLNYESSVLATSQHRLTLLDERTDERAQLVQGGPASLNMLLKREWEIAALLQLAPEHHERSEDESAKKRIQVRRAHGHTFRYAPDLVSPAFALALQQNGAAAKRPPSGIFARPESALADSVFHSIGA